MMQDNQKQSIAWFKLAEYISRGEKERALGLYRLLSHTLENSPFELQLAGDILRACNDKERAIEKYLHAAQLYEKSEKFSHACGVYDHVLLLDPERQDLKIKRALLAAYMHDEERLGRMVCSVLLSAQKISYETIVSCIDELCVASEKNIRMFCWQAVAWYALKQSTFNQGLMQAICKKTIDELSAAENSLELEKFLSRLESIDPAMSHYLREYIDELHGAPTSHIQS